MIKTTKGKTAKLIYQFNFTEKGSHEGTRGTVAHFMAV